MSRLTIALLGPPRVERDGQAIQVDTRKAIALLAYLIVRAGDMFDMIERWIEDYDVVVFERDEEDEPMVTWDREQFIGHYMAMPHCWPREEAERCYDQNVRGQEDEGGQA